MKLFIITVYFFAMFLSFVVQAAVTSTTIKKVSQPDYWQQVFLKPSTFSTTNINTSINNNYRIKAANKLTADMTVLTDLLLNTSSLINGGTATVILPLPNGEFAEFLLSYSTIIAPALADKYPEIKTFSGYQIGHPENSGRFDITPQGFHGMFRFNQETVFIEPEAIFDPENQSVTSLYLSYYRKNTQQPADTVNRFVQQSPKIISPNQSVTFEQSLKQLSSLNINSLNLSAAKQAKPTQSSLTTYRLAISATGEYSQYHGGTKSSVLAALITLVNRLNEVYQRDLSVKLELVADNDELIFLNSSTDPFSNDDQDGDINTTVINNIIGSQAYDIGHVLNTQGGGLAVLSSVCHNIYKGDGVTGNFPPINDAFYIDYVAHEIGHQFGAGHTFNGTEGACEGNRHSDSAYEPGSASTIMSYASPGLCGSQSLQNQSDPYFHAKSIEQIETNIQQGVIGSSCGSSSGAIVNNIPEVSAGNNYTIPAHTPFILMGSASDDDIADTLSYSWQQIDLGAASQSVTEQVDNGNRPLFRVFNPTETPTRTFPQLSDVLTNTVTIGEVYAMTDRALNFRLLVRDNQGGVGFDDNQITVVNTLEAFTVTLPDSGTNWTTIEQVITWNTADTEIAPISCQFVDILLSTDSGQSFPVSLAERVSNNGRYDAELPTTHSSQSRIKISCSDNIFFAINGGDFTINVDNFLTPIITGQQNLSIQEGESISLTVDLFNYDQINAESLIILVNDHYTVENNEVIPEQGFTGELSVRVIAVANGIESDEFLASVSVVEQTVTPNANTSATDQSSSGGSVVWLTFYLFIFIYLKSQNKLLLIRKRG